jgi:hypothetical protein
LETAVSQKAGTDEQSNRSELYEILGRTYLREKNPKAIEMLEHSIEASVSVSGRKKENTTAQLYLLKA